MRNKIEDEKLFALVRGDVQSWLAQARQLRLSADVIYPEWEKVVGCRQSIPGVREKMLAFSQSFMLLVGFAFENLLKGILYGRDPNNSLVKSKGGHGIVQMAKGVTKINSDELDLLERLEIYLIWAGRYQLPMTSDAFHASQGKVSITTRDHDTVCHLFDRLQEVLQAEWRARGGS